MRKPLLAIGFLFLALVSPAAGARKSDGSAIVKAAGDEYRKFLEQRSLGLRVRLGLPVEELEDISEKRVKEDAAFATSLLAKLAVVKEADLDHEETLSRAILESELTPIRDAPRFYWLTFPVTPYASPLRTVHLPFTGHAFQAKADLDHYLRLLSLYADLIASMEAKLVEQEKRGIRIPRPEIPLVVKTFETIGQPADRSLFRVETGRLAAIPAAEREDFVRRVAAAIETRIVPALKSLTRRLSGDYSANAPESVGLSQYPGGREFYRYLVRLYTTLDVTPEEVHQIGLAEVGRINRELESIRAAVKFPGSLAEFRSHLKTDPRFFPKTPEEIGERLMAAQRRLVPKVPLYFGKTPKAPYGVARLDPALEGAMTYGYYDGPKPTDPKGYYYYNASNLGSRSLLNAAPLIYHELVPGHHFQIALQRENASLPPFRQEAAQTAYTEGWGEYASALAGEMGMYEDPYDRAGRLVMDVFLSVRLVVDTGMNDLGWSRERAMAYMKENTLESDAQIATESLRYSCDIPGQALAYKIGSKKIRDLREKARKELGSSFDIRRFHDVVLGSGSMPLSVLERHVDRFVSREKARKE